MRTYTKGVNSIQVQQALSKKQGNHSDGVCKENLNGFDAFPFLHQFLQNIIWVTASCKQSIKTFSFNPPPRKFSDYLSVELITNSVRVAGDYSFGIVISCLSLCSLPLICTIIFFLFVIVWYGLEQLPKVSCQRTFSGSVTLSRSTSCM